MPCPCASEPASGAPAPVFHWLWGSARVIVRDARDSDLPQVLALNEGSVHWLSPLDAPALADLHRMAALHRVVESGGEVVAFLLVLSEGAAYASPNYRWFAAHFDRFLYVDRIVVSPACRGQRVGDVLYRDMFEFADRTAAPRVTCEFDIDPPNQASRRFHERHGFTEVGAQQVAVGGKRVSLQAVELAPRETIRR